MQASHGKDIELGTAYDEAESLEPTVGFILKIALDFDEQRAAGQQAFDSAAVEVSLRGLP